MSIKALITLTIVILVLGGCASKDLNNNPLSAKTTDAQTAHQAQSKDVTPNRIRWERCSELLLFIDSFSNSTPEVQKKIFNETNQALIAHKSDLTQRIKLAMMLALPSSRMRDVGKAQNLLQALSQDNSLDPAEAALTSLVYDYSLDSTKQNQKNKEDLKKLDSSQQKLEVLQQKLEALQQKYDVLDKKLNDLKEIEKTMNDRDSKAVNKLGAKPYS